MWAVIGEQNDVYQEYIGEPFEDHYSEEIVALFTTKEKAKQYIKKSKLKNPVRHPFWRYKIFRDNSLLRYCEDARIEEFQETNYLIDPEPPGG